MRSYFDLTKFGIVCFVLFTGIAAYFLAQPTFEPIDNLHFFFFSLALYFLSSGSFALNQYQERDTDKLMERTKNRPLPSASWSPNIVLILSILLILLGCVFSYLVDQWVLIYGLATIVLYNGFYTVIWKKHWIFGAVPGAIPGAMPIALGYGAHGIPYSRESVYLFVLMFLWQMPHFWALAIKYKEDYRKAGIPVLPAALGDNRTFYHMGLYVFAYAAWAVVAPWFISVWLGYLVVILPFVCKVVWEFWQYYKEQTSRNWLSFFLWTTFSVLVFVMIPVFDRWGEIIFNRL